MQTLTFCNTKVTSTRTAVSQFKGQFNGAMEEMSRQGKKASTHTPGRFVENIRLVLVTPLPCHRWRFHRPASRQRKRGQVPCGAMDESSGKGSKMQAHISSGVVMDIAAFKVSHSVGVDQDATALQAKKWSA